MKGLEDLYIEQLKDLYSAEKQLIQALPKMAKAANTDALRQGFETHLQQTQMHKDRLEQIFSRIGSSPGRKKCEGMEGLIKEGEEAIELQGDALVKDAALIAAAQRVEHYEIAGYGTVRTFATQLGYPDDTRLLQQTLNEEGETDKKLSALAEGGLGRNGINEQAAQGDGSTANRRSR